MVVLVPLHWQTWQAPALRARRHILPTLESRGCMSSTRRSVRKNVHVKASIARTAWHRLEAVNAVAYFSRECRQGLKDAGLPGFWMGYFACRAAPMGPVTPGVVEATFFNFHPAMVRRSIPDAWALVPPEAVLSVRQQSAAAVLLRLLPGTDASVHQLLPILWKAIEHGSGAGRPLFAANRDVSGTDDLAGLWQAATTLREHRGDGHVAVLTEADMGACEAHVLFAATEGCPPELLRENRGWSVEDWETASEVLKTRGSLTPSGVATDSGRQLRSAIEQRTDQLAVQPYLGLSVDEIDGAIRLLTGIASRIVDSGEIPFPNPMGLPAPSAIR